MCGDIRWFAPVPESGRDGDADYACIACGAAVLVPAGASGQAAVA
jgi:hypothetical protein